MTNRIKIAAVALLALLLAAPAGAASKNRVSVLLDSVTVTDALANTVSVTNANHGAAYLRIRAGSEVGTASLAVTVTLREGVIGADPTICTVPAITDNGVTLVLLGSAATAAEEGVSKVCALPLPRDFDVTYTISGASSSFAITSELYWVQY